MNNENSEGAKSNPTTEGKAPHKHSLMRKLIGLLLTGLAAVVPVVGTIWLLVIIYKIFLLWVEFSAFLHPCNTALFNWFCCSQ